jgi:hypothetical protein
MLLQRKLALIIITFSPSCIESIFLLAGKRLLSFPDEEKLLAAHDIAISDIRFLSVYLTLYVL